MLKIKKEHPNISLVPCYDNDLIWHTHQQFPLAYQEDTSSMLGKMLDHNDATNHRSPGSELENASAAKKKRFEKKKDINSQFLEQCTEENPLGQRLNQISVGLVL